MTEMVVRRRVQSSRPSDAAAPILTDHFHQNGRKSKLEGLAADIPPFNSYCPFSPREINYNQINYNQAIAILG